MVSTYQINLFFLLTLTLCCSHAISRTLEPNYVWPESTKSKMDKFEQWITRHGHEYKSVTDKLKRFKIFQENMKRIEEFNSNGRANKSYTLGLNAFSDMTMEEFQLTYTGYNGPEKSRDTITSTSVPAYNSSLVLEESVDWRERGAVTPAKMQGSCEACWAFSSIAAVEAIHKIKNGSLVSFSEQQLVDCVQPNGCKPGFMTHAYEYIQANGVFTEEDYPYTAKPGKCTVAPNNLVKISGYVHSSFSDDPTELLQAVSQQPVSVGIDTHSAEFNSYSSGVYDGGCGTNLNHAVTVIGYGTDSKSGQDYWLIKNSWGESWGENGFMRLLRDESLCPITTECSYPLMD